MRNLFKSSNWNDGRAVLKQNKRIAHEIVKPVIIIYTGLVDVIMGL